VLKSLCAAFIYNLVTMKKYKQLTAAAWFLLMPCLALLLSGFVYRTMHWHYGVELFQAGFYSTLIVVAALIFLSKKAELGFKVKNIRFIILALPLLFAAFVGYVFKLQHWAGGNAIFISAIVLWPLSGIVYSLYMGIKILKQIKKEEEFFNSI